MIKPVCGFMISHVPWDGLRGPMTRGWNPNVLGWITTYYYYPLNLYASQKPKAKFAEIGR